jgi:hypothetical protein
MRPPAPEALRHDMASVDAFVRRCTLNFPDHRATLARLKD